MTKETHIKVMIVEPNKAPKIEVIENSLKSLQGIVGGYIEVARGDGFEIVFNEEGKLMELEPNFAIFEGADFISGTAIFLSADNSTGEFTSLTTDKIPFLTAYVLADGRTMLDEAVENMKSKGFF